MLMVKKNNHSKPFLEEINPRLELLSAHCYSNNKPIYFKNNSRGTGENIHCIMITLFLKTQDPEHTG